MGGVGGVRGCSRRWDQSGEKAEEVDKKAKSYLQKSWGVAELWSRSEARAGESGSQKQEGSSRPCPRRIQRAQWPLSSSVFQALVSLDSEIAYVFIFL